MQIVIQRLADNRYLASYTIWGVSAYGTGATAKDAVGDLVYHHPSHAQIQFAEEDLRKPQMEVLSA